MGALNSSNSDIESKGDHADYRDVPAFGESKNENNIRLSPKARIALIVLILAALYITLPPVLQWQRTGEERALSLSNIRRVGLGTLMYAQDWDSNTMPPIVQTGDHAWQTWPTLLRSYVSPDSTFSNPANPVIPFHSSLRDPFRDFAVNTSYALNHRFWNTFGPGSFPIDNLELPEQTVLLVEAGRMWKNPLKTSDGLNVGVLEYTDTCDRIHNLSPFPSSHAGRMAVVAADGHGVLITVQHYSAKEGMHDALYGRLGSGIYNWNGGHPNGATDVPSRE